MKIIRALFAPLQIINKKTMWGIIIAEAILALFIWQLEGGGLIPTPSEIGIAVMKILESGYFWDNFFSSLTLTLQGMGISILLALLISYLSLLPFFKPVARFVIKCRYLTMTGLIFLFTLLTHHGHQLKISLLIFGIVPFFVTSFLSVVDRIDVQEYELCTTLGMSRWQTLLEVVIIGRLDQVLEVMRQNFAIAWMMITMVEGLSMSEGGLGTLLIKSNKYIDLGTVFGILVIIFFIGVIFDYALAKTRYWLFPYTKLQMLDK